jgi:hypothetical protein
MDQKNVTAVAGGIGIDKINELLPGHVIVSVLVLNLGKAGYDLLLAAQIGSLDPCHMGIAERLYHTLNPIRSWLAVGIGKEYNLTPGVLQAQVASDCGPRARLREQTHLTMSRNSGPGLIRGTVINYNDFITLPGDRLLRQGIQAAVNGTLCLVSWNDNGGGRVGKH